jgi:meso-butanediol dehydrogenase / (S,S)-butanediol dehydrogenase / diacetyl reductase
MDFCQPVLNCPMLLNNKVIFLTGGSTGIGLDCAKAYAAEGAKVVLCARDGELAAKEAAQLPGTHYGIRCDVSNGAEVEKAIAFTLDKFGRLDCVHNNAGIASPSKALHETSEEEWDALMAINLKSVYWTTRHAYSHLKASKGCILNTSSLVGVIGQAIHAAYTSTKGAMNTLTKSMALDYAADGIRVNAVCPAGTWTPMLRQWASEQPDPAGIEKYLDEIHALGYCPEGDVIADSCVFLISDKARFVTGHIMHVSGGAEIGYRR